MKISTGHITVGLRITRYTSASMKWADCDQRSKLVDNMSPTTPVLKTSDTTVSKNRTKVVITPSATAAFPWSKMQAVAPSILDCIFSWKRSAWRRSTTFSTNLRISSRANIIIILESIRELPTTTSVGVVCIGLSIGASESAIFQALSTSVSEWFGVLSFFTFILLVGALLIITYSSSICSSSSHRTVLGRETSDFQ